MNNNFRKPRNPEAYEEAKRRIEEWESQFDGKPIESQEAIEDIKKLWHETIDKTIQICEKHGLKLVDSIDIHANGLMGSYGHHEWTPYTDSSICLYDGLRNELYFGA